jgi:ribonuclease J
MLRFIALSGTVSVTENLYVYEAEGRMMIVDCGVGFPDLDMRGVDLVIPDFSYIVKNKSKLSGIIVSQGHEDHMGAIPFLLRDVNVPIYAAPLVVEFLKDKLDEFGIKDYKLNTFNPDSGDFMVGPFRVQPFSVTHSVPDTVGFAIDTPEGRIMHIPEHRIDQDPVVGHPFNIPRATELSKNVLFLASDCLGSNKPGFVNGEREVQNNIENIAKRAKFTVFTTAISSNIGRFQQMLNVADNIGRKVVLVGRSIQKKIEMAYKLGYIKYPPDLIISFKEAKKLKRDKLFYIVSGCYGQVGSSLHQMALGEHQRVQVAEGDTMIFSANPAPPYSKETQDFVIDQLTDKEVDVHYYELNEGTYVSGHGGQDDILELFKIVRPKYFIPIGGAIRYLKAYEKLLVTKFSTPDDHVFRLKPGENIIFEKGQVRYGEKIHTKEVMVHGLGVGDVGKVVLGDRAVLGTEGVAVAVIKLGKGKKILGVSIISRGFVFEKFSKELIKESERRLMRTLERKGKTDKTSINAVTLDYLENYFFQKTGRRPMILPVVVEIS